MSSKGGFAIGTSVFLRLLAVIHLAAFLSFWVQCDGLVGPHGLLPAVRFFPAAHAQLGAAAYAQAPSLCWLCGAGRFLPVLCAVGIGLSLLLFAGVAPAACLALLWACYLSLACAGQIFYEFQWDSLLLETTLLAVFAAPWRLRPGWKLFEPPRLARWLLWWLLFRLMLLSGLVKLTSGDPTWRHLTALTFHYETQPLPTPLAWYASHLPFWFQRLSCALMFAIELAAPFALLAGRRVRHAGILALAGLQVLIALTGNYTFFNALALALCLAALDDDWWRSLARRCGLVRPSAPAGDDGATAKGRWALLPFAAFVFAFTLAQALADFVPGLGRSEAMNLVAGAVSPFRSLNNYGLFAVMTTTRPELIFEGSDDGSDWRPYEFPHKPGDLARRPEFVAPYQPRLDWQLWFAALEPPEENRWVLLLCEQLLRGNSHVLALLSHNPFPGGPPHYIRVVRYEYHFTTTAERARTGNWWKRDWLDLYVPPASLR